MTEDEEPKTWAVSFPVTGSYTVTVEADSEKAAIEAAWEADDGDLEWDRVERIVQGNVFYGSQNEIYAEEV